MVISIMQKYCLSSHTQQTMRIVYNNIERYFAEKDYIETEKRACACMHVCVHVCARVRVYIYIYVHTLEYICNTIADAFPSVVVFFM